MTKRPDFLYGVNLGGWLVLERWLTPSLFSGLKARDEVQFCQELGSEADSILKLHRDNFITEADFAWLAEHGINAIRLPVGYWLFGDDQPYVGAIEYVDRAFGWAKKYELQVLLDLHGAPGSQNGRHHSGRIGTVDWPGADNMQHTLEILERLAKRYASEPQLWGIELVNEPNWQIGRRRLKQFYEAGYAAVRKHCGHEVAVVFSDSYHPTKWRRVLSGRPYQNCLLDVHHYQSHGKRHKRRRLSQHIQLAAQQADILRKAGHHHHLIIGEWSLALPAGQLRHLGHAELDWLRRGYAATQLLSFAGSDGWFFWTYRAEANATWSYRTSVERGWLPDNIGQK